MIQRKIVILGAGESGIGAAVLAKKKARLPNGYRVDTNIISFGTKKI